MSTATAKKGGDNSIRKMLISAEDYHRMGKAGIFDDKPRVELIDGEIYTMSPITPDHNGHVDKIATFFTVKLFERAQIRTQGSIRTDEYSEPEPDISILKYRADYYSKKQATAKDTLVVIEVSVFTLERNRTTKKKKYAESGIPEYWIVSPQKKTIEVYKNPEGETYTEKETYKIDDSWKFDAFDLEVKGSDFLIA